MKKIKKFIGRLKRRHELKTDAVLLVTYNEQGLLPVQEIELQMLK
jgi:hypothetical protein